MTFASSSEVGNFSLCRVKRRAKFKAVGYAGQRIVSRGGRVIEMTGSVAGMCLAELIATHALRKFLAE